MIQQNIKHQAPNEKGSAILVCLIVIVVLTTISIFGLKSSEFEMETSGAERREKNNFFNAESGLKFAISYFRLIYNNRIDLTSTSPLYAENASGAGISGTVSIDSSGNLVVADMPTGDTSVTLQNMPIDTGAITMTYAAPSPTDSTITIPTAYIEIRAIMVNPPAISDLSSAANTVPSRFHIGPAPPGYSNTLFSSRNYCITSTALDQNGDLTRTSIQCGVDIAALKDSVIQLKGL